MPDFVALRASPDWPNFDLSDARPFLRSIGFAENMLDEFVTIWDAALTLDYRSFRDRLKAIAVETAVATGAALIGRSQVEARAPDDRIVFLDDDDWLAPDLFAHLAPADAAEGQRWQSVRIGLDYDPTAAGAALIQCRSPSAIVYTNNYMVTGRGIGRHGVEAVFEHTVAQAMFDREDFGVIDRPFYLSCAVKHPCSTTAIRHLLALPAFRQDPLAVVEAFAQRLATAIVPAEAAWLAGPVAGLVDLLNEASRA